MAELGSRKEIVKDQVQNHEALIVLRCSIYLNGHSESDPCPIDTLFKAVQKQIDMDWSEVFKCVLQMRPKLFCSMDNWETVYLHQNKASLLRELLKFFPVIRSQKSDTKELLKMEMNFKVKNNKNSIDFTNLLGYYSFHSKTFVPKFQIQGQHRGIPFTLPENKRYSDGGWFKVSLRFSKKPSSQFSCEVFNLESIPFEHMPTHLETPTTAKSKPTHSNVLIHNILAHILTSTYQKMRVKDVQLFVKVELKQDLLEERLREMLVNYPDLFHLHKETNKSIVSMKKFTSKSVEAYLTLGNDVSMVRNVPKLLRVERSENVTMEVRQSRTETLLVVAGLSGRLEDSRVIFRVSDKPGTTFSMPAQSTFFHNESKGSVFTFNLQVNLLAPPKSELRFGMVPGKKSEGQIEKPSPRDYSKDSTALRKRAKAKQNKLERAEKESPMWDQEDSLFD